MFNVLCEVLGARNMGGPNMIPPQQQQSMNRSVQQLLMNHNYNSAQQRNNSHLKPGKPSLCQATPVARPNCLLVSYL